MTADRVADLESLERALNESLAERVEAQSATAAESAVVEAVGAQLRWAIWCLECLRELRDVVDITDPRGLGETPQGYRPQPTAMGHVMWASTTAMGALDRAAAAFGAIHLPPLPKGRLHDLGSLHESRSALPKEHPVRLWLHAVANDPAYRDLLGLLRHPLVHRTTPMALRARVGGAPVPWERLPPHQDAPGFYLPGRDLKIDPTYRRSVTVVEFLDEVSPSAHRHVEAAVALTISGAAFEGSGIAEGGPAERP